MTRFVDGPATGVVLQLRRAPCFLRAVQHRGTHAWDALDQLGDTPGADEDVVVYELVGDPTWVHVCARGGHGGTRQGGTYRVVDPQPPEDVVRDRARWHEWAAAQFEARQRVGHADDGFGAR